MAESQRSAEGQPSFVDVPAPPGRPETDVSRPKRPLIDWQDVLIAGLLVVIVALAAYYRFVGQNWDDYTHLHPDERFLTTVASSISPVSGIDQYFNTHESSLNPNNRGAGLYVYGTLPLFVVKAASGITIGLTGDPTWGSYNRIQLVGRSVSAVADLLTLLFLFLLGRRLYGRWTGLLAATLYAGAVLPVTRTVCRSDGSTFGLACRGAAGWLPRGVVLAGARGGLGSRRPAGRCCWRRRFTPGRCCRCSSPTSGRPTLSPACR